MKKILFILSLISIIFLLTSCQQERDTQKLENQVERNLDTEITKEGDTTEIENDEAKIEVTEGNTGSWCEEGTEWNFESKQEQGNAKWTIVGLVNSGEYKGLCHVLYTAKTEEDEMKMDYYFSEDGKSGYYEMDVNGRKIKQEWQG